MLPKWVPLLRRSSTDSGRPGEQDFPGGNIEPGDLIQVEYLVGVAVKVTRAVERAVPRKRWPSRIHVAHLREEFMEFCDSLNLDAILEAMLKMSERVSDRLGYARLGTLIGLYMAPGILVALPGGLLVSRRMSACRWRIHSSKRIWLSALMCEVIWSPCSC